MPTKRALIVDDSKTAQFKLSKTLEVYDLVIDTVLSGEEALSYLSYQVPDVIFMDHSMKGMSGLDAVKIIKSNIATATIPVVMYTAQSGEVYLSQARAMGAIGVLSKDVITESDLQHVMSSIKLLPKDVAVNADSKADSKADSSTQNPVLVSEPPRMSDDLVRIRDQVAKSLDIQQGQLRNELQDNTRVLVNRFMREIRGLRDDMARQKKIDREHLDLILENEHSPGFLEFNPWWIAVVSLLGVSLLWFIWSAHSAEQRAAAISSELQTLKQTALLQQPFATIQPAQTAVNVRDEEVSLDKMLRALEWAINLNGQFAFAEEALGDTRVDLLVGMLDYLTGMGFTGILSFDIHNGDFCVVLNDDGNLQLPPETASVAQCELIGNTAYNFDSASQTSLAFLTLLQSYPVVDSGALEIEIKAHGLSRPIARYPLEEAQVSAGEWNAVAAQNNRVEVSLRAK